MVTMFWILACEGVACSCQLIRIPKLRLRHVLWNTVVVIGGLSLEIMASRKTISITPEKCFDQ